MSGQSEGEASVAGTKAFTEQITGKSAVSEAGQEGQPRPAYASDVENATEPVRARPRSEEVVAHQWKQQKALDALRLDDHRLDHNLKRTLGYGAAGFLVAQVLIADCLFGFYLGKSFAAGNVVSGPAMVAWVSATVVEVVGVVAIIAKYLFPSKGNSWTAEPPPLEEEPSGDSRDETDAQGADQA